MKEKGDVTITAYNMGAVASSRRYANIFIKLKASNKYACQTLSGPRARFARRGSNGRNVRQTRTLRRYDKRGPPRSCSTSWHGPMPIAAKRHRTILFLHLYHLCLALRQRARLRLATSSGVFLPGSSWLGARRTL